VIAAALAALALLAPAPAGLAAPKEKEIAMQLVSSAENSSLDWRAQYRYIEDIHDGRGYTAGIIGFCSGTGDMLEVVRAYAKKKPHSRLARFLPALRRVDGTDSHKGLGKPFVRAWRKAAKQKAMRRAQELTEQCDLFLAIGSSLVVWPAAGFPLAAKRNGARLVIINRDETEFDEIADLVLHDDIGAALAPFIAH